MPTDYARVAREIKVMAERIREASDKAERELAGVRFTGGSQLVTAEADVRARIVGLRIARGGLTRTRADELARQVVDAVAEAREEARTQYQRAMREAAR